MSISDYDQFFANAHNILFAILYVLSRIFTSLAKQYVPIPMIDTTFDLLLWPIRSVLVRSICAVIASIP